MTDPQRDYEALFVEHLPFVERTVGVVARIMGFGSADAEEFAAWAKARLWEHDYAVFRKWRGESLLPTYLVSVVTNLGREFRVQRWGRWRASAAAQRLGPLAVRLETLVYRDGLAPSAAGELLRQRGETDLSDRELARLLGELPVRRRPRRVDDREVAIDAVPGTARADDAVDEDEEDAERRATYAVLEAALRRLSSEEQIVIRMHYLQGRTLADVARALHVEQRPLYRVKDRALAKLASELRSAGVTPERVRELLGGALAGGASAGAPDAMDERGGNSATAGPSKTACSSSPPDGERATPPPAERAAPGDEP
jgi:RNA polymerase sigma factor for flagellar operon FliA